MRLFYFLPILLINPLSFAADCTVADFVPPTTSYTCDNLIINSTLDLSGKGDLFPAAIDITATNVMITADIILDGAAGSTFVADNSDGGIGGPGASVGGGFHGQPEPGGIFTADLENGQEGVNDPALCGSGGGGGGGSFSAGADGSICNGGATFGAKGLQSSFAAFVGGFGGGAGGERGTNPVFDLGGGGGGGGTIRINATGTITIANGVLISTRGGRGGDSTGEGGAGGGGGAGNIHLIAASLVNQGIFDVRGGDKGVNTRTVGVKGGNGGKGGDGIIRLEIGGAGPVDSSGRQDFSTGTPTTNRSSLNSSISCASLAKKNDSNNLIFQMSFGFMMAIILRILFRYQKKVSLTFVFRN